MFEADVDGIFLKKLTESLKDICGDVNIECDVNGMEMQAMDDSHIALVHLCLAAEFFPYYRCDKPVILGVNLSNLMKVLAFVKEGQMLKLRKDDKDENNPVLQIFSEADCERMAVDLKLVDMEKEHLQVPDQNYNACTSMNAKKFNECVKHLNNIAETVIISTSKHTMEMTVEGTEAKITKQFAHTVDSNEVIVECKDEVEQEFALRLLHLFSKASSFSSSVKICQSEGIPLALKFDMSKQSDSAAGHISFFLAPKISE